MNVDFARPDISDLTFRVFGRSVHPELLNRYAHTEVVQDAFRADLYISESGHVISFRHGGHTLTEMTAGGRQPLPRRKCCLEGRLRGAQDGSVVLEDVIRYSVNYQLENLAPEVFLNFHEELSIDCARAALSQRFPAGTRLAPGAISVLQVDAGPRALLVHAFHTFPENCAVVKTQSLFEL